MVIKLLLMLKQILLVVDLSEAELKQRSALWIQPELKYKSGSLYKYAKLVSSASEGCVTDEN